jgi:hypothetical protein
MYCYRFPDRDTFVAACGTLGWLSEPSEEAPEAVVIHYTHDRAIDEVGPVQTLPGTYDEEGVELTAPEYDTRHHINFQGEAPLEWDQYLVNVNTPSRMFAGSGTPTTLDQLNELRNPSVEEEAK